MTIKKAVILCGGLATRFLPISKCVGKEMLPILNKPIIDILVSELVDAGIEEILIVLGREKEILEKYFDKNIEVEERLKITNKIDELKEVQKTYSKAIITFIRQINPWGTGYATSLAKNFVGDQNFILLFGDELIFNKTSCTKQMLKVFETHKSNIIAVKSVPKKDVYKYGIIDFEKTSNKNVFKLNNIVEKPKIDEAPSNFSYIGPAILSPKIFDKIESVSDQTKLEIGITDIYKKLLKDEEIFACNIVGKRFDVGSPIGLIKANIFAGIKNKNSKKELYEFIKKIN